MNLGIQLTDKTFDLFAANNYNNPRCVDIQEFYDDLGRFKCIRRLFKKYSEKGILEERKILNEIIIIHNVFFLKAASRMCFYKLDMEYWSALKTFLLYLNLVSDEDYTHIPIDLSIVHKLQHL